MTNSNTSATGKLVYQLEEMILEGVWRPNHKLPSERRLAQRFGYSRTVIREALRQLQAKGLIITHQGIGSYVVEVFHSIEEEFIDPLVHLFDSHERTLFDLLDVREQLESHAAFLAAQRATQTDLYQLTQAYERLASPDTELTMDTYFNFHHMVILCSHNPILVQTLCQLKALLCKAIQTCLPLLIQDAEVQNQVRSQQQQMYEAIVQRDPVAARRATKTHIRFVSHHVHSVKKSSFY